MSVGVTNFPVGLDSHVNASPPGFGALRHRTYTGLSAPITAGATTIPVGSVSNFPPNGYLVIGSEVVKYTGTTGGVTFDGATRGVDGSTAAAHAAGTPVVLAPVAGHHNDLAAAIAAVEAKLGTGAGTSVDNVVLRGTSTGGSGWGKVQTGDITADAATQVLYAPGVTSNPSTTSTTFVDMTDMSIPVTIAATGTKLVVHFSGMFTHSQTPVLCALRLTVASVQQGEERYFHAHAIVGSSVSVAAVWLVSGLAVGSHTFKVQYQTATGQLTAYVRTRAMVITEHKR
jgi:hypothetical protein